MITEKQTYAMQADANREWFDRSMNEAIRLMEKFIEEAKRDMARSDEQMTPLQKVQAVHKHLAWGLANATSELNNASSYAVGEYHFRMKAL